MLGQFLFKIKSYMLNLWNDYYGVSARIYFYIFIELSIKGV